ncbi:MAG: hypothetical protein QT05_C0001G0033 [archaeon GW2011_AR13]|nr:MAG: hypothetical protein QT05_C0001G0033 [archaeon GW2011_AR13]
MLKTISFPIICLMLILSIGFISANILIAGTVYDGKPNLIKSGVLVNITCDSDILQTTSLSDGAYAVVFDTDSCTSVLVESEYDVTEIIMEVEDDSPQTTTTTSSGGGSGSSRSSNLRYYFCGNGVCDTGETFSTCPKDCTIIELSTDLTNLEDSSGDEEIKETIEETENPSKTSSPITGAVIGTIKGHKFSFVFLAVILITGIGLIIFKRK